MSFPVGDYIPAAAPKGLKSALGLVANYALKNPSSAVYVGKSLRGIADYVLDGFSGSRPRPQPISYQPKNFPRRDRRTKRPRTISPPVSVGTYMVGRALAFSKPKNEPGETSGIRVTGQEILCPAGYTPLSSQGAFMYLDSVVGTPNKSYLRISPTEIGTISGSRLGLYGQMFDKFRFRSFKLTFVTNSATSHNGALSAGYCADTYRLDGNNHFDGMLNCTPSFITPCYSNCSLVIKAAGKSGDLLYCRKDVDWNEREAFQGAISAYVDTTFTGDASIVAGYWLIEYVCDFYAPCLNPDIMLALKLVKSRRDVAESEKKDSKTASSSTTSGLLWQRPGSPVPRNRDV